MVGVSDGGSAAREKWAAAGVIAPDAGGSKRGWGSYKIL